MCSGLGSRSGSFLLHADLGAANPMNLMRVGVYLAIAVALGYTVLRFRRKQNGFDSRERNHGFRPQIGFTRLDGMVSLSLLLQNESGKSVWAEEIEIFLSGLEAEQQTSEPSCRGIQTIRQMVRSGDTLPISLCEAIYKAAGSPQRKYSCVMSSVLRYRIGEEWFEEKMQNYNLRMIGLTVADVQRERKRVPSIQPGKKSREVSAAAVKQKQI
jgi:hypothetical protein